MATLTQTTKEKTDKAIVQKVSGAEAVIRSFLAEGVDMIFGYPGSGRCYYARV